MSRIVLFLACSLLILQSCEEKTAPKREIYNAQFNWSITIPEGFDSLSAEQWAKMQNRGAEAIEKTFNEKVENNSKTIFVFRSDNLNYFESNHQPFDTTTDGNYLESFRSVNQVLYETFLQQMEGVTVDTTASSTEMISGLEFQKAHMKITYPNKMIMHYNLFSRLFGKQEFSVNIMYVDEKKGEEMLKAWRSSKFGGE